MKNNSNNKINIFQTINDLSINSGGPSKTVTQLSSQLSCNQDLNISIITSTKNNNGSIPNVKPKNYNVNILNSSKKLNINPIFDYPYYKTLLINISNNRNNIIHDNGLWLASNNTVSIFANKYSIPILISPHGMLEPWSLNYNYYKKKLAWITYQYKNLKKAHAIHATSIQEANNIKKLNLNTPIAIIPNGINIPSKSLVLNAIEYKLEKNISKENIVNNYLYVGRIHPKKGLLNLLKALKELVITHPDSKLIIAGPSESGYKKVLENYIYTNNMKDHILFKGSVHGKELEDLYLSSDVFILPTYSENFGVVVAEALSYGLPVITTHGAPWPELNQTNSGWWVEASSKGIMNAMKSSKQLDLNKYREMTLNAVNLSLRFEWENISNQYLAIYKWLLGISEKPKDIVL